MAVGMVLYVYDGLDIVGGHVLAINLHNNII